MELELSKVVDSKNVCVSHPKQEYFLENKPLVIVSQESLASEKSQVNDELLPFSTEDEIDSLLFNS